MRDTARVGSAAIKPARTVGRLLRRYRQRLGLTQQEVSDRLADRGDRLPPSTLVRIEQGKLDPGVRRLHHLLGLYQIPPRLVSDLVELEAMAVEVPVDDDLESVFQRGVEHWKRGEHALGLAHLIAVREHVPDDDSASLLRQKACLGFATAARDMGKYELAKEIVDDLLCEPCHESILLETLVLASSVWRGLGSLPMSRAVVREAGEHVPEGDHRKLAYLRHQEAQVLYELGCLEEAASRLDEAERHYTAVKDEQGKGRTLLLRCEVLAAEKRYAEAIIHARKLVRLAARHELKHLAPFAHTLLGRFQAHSGDDRRGETELRKGLSLAMMNDDGPAEFLAHYYLWKFFDQRGDTERAGRELDRAFYLSSMQDPISPEVREVRRVGAERGLG